MVGKHAANLDGHFASPHDPHTPSLPATGCQEKNCQRQAPAPIGPPHGLVLLRSIERAYRLSNFERAAPSAAWLQAVGTPKPLDGHHLPIEHPPRLGS